MEQPRSSGSSQVEQPKRAKKTSTAEPGINGSTSGGRKGLGGVIGGMTGPNASRSSSDYHDYQIQID